MEPGDSPGNHLYDWIEKLGNLLAGHKTLFLIDSIIADEILDKWRQPLLGLAISRRHKGHPLWLLTQSYTAIPMNIRRQVKILYVWYLKKQGDWDTIHEVSNINEMLEELSSVKKKLRQGKHTCLVMRREHMREYEIRWMSYQNHYKTPSKRLQHTYKMPAKRLRHSYGTTVKTPTALLQHAYQDFYSTPSKRLLHSNRTPISKMIEYLSFLLLCTLVALLLHF